MTSSPRRRRRTRTAHLSAFCLALAVPGVAGAGVGSAATPQEAAACIGSGDVAGITAALQGQGAQAVLCPGATFSLTAPIGFTAPDQTISTQGLPTGSGRATLVVTGAAQSTAIQGNGQSGVVVENVQINGNRVALGRIDGGGALMEMGGAGSGETVRNVNAYQTRGWSTLHMTEGTVTDSTPACQNAKILDNRIAQAGTGSPSGTWADGISLACGHSEVSGNTVEDATDGGIVIFGAPGSVVENNTVTALTQTELGAINMVDYAPMNGNYTGTVVRNNVIDGKSAFIKVAIAMGPQVWGCGTGTNYGATVTGNTVQGENVGYGYAVNGVSGWTVTGNTDTARHVGVTAGACGGATSQPGTFQYQSAAASTLQSEFAGGQHLEYLLGVSEPGILKEATPSTSCGRLDAHQGLYPGQTLTSCDGRFTLNLQGDGNLVLRQGTATLWSSGTTGRGTAEALLQGDGNVVLYDTTAAGVWSSGTPNNPGAWLSVQNDGNVVVYTSSGSPLWSTGTAGH
ncbi:right-handed parallel beta-helix repeat-containing protein [Actinacidiphila rubida]|uniref:Parallel beta-helix repeat (Two copies) n=1 Tax=Actinacidiphila rubida TaxID=310780 RepID=A0A1H8KN15_9ACTN|nr:right-handed parallel beta-helix repeat-containing protein [Actinacidiphila rubida]SEN94244.1 parallel beta-helix repeat (two copies) [Actinacidiphila rubida]